MALSATQTRESQKSVETALAERQRRERDRRQKQDEADRKQRELEAKLRLKHFEDEKREKERQRLKEDKIKALEAARQRREEEERDHLRYGAKKPGKPETKWPSSSSQTQTQESVRKRRFPSEEGEASGSAILTREEKRQRREQAQYRSEFRSARRPSARSYSKAGRQLPGGAIDVMTTTPGLPPLSLSAGMTARERLAAVPMHLIKLNTNKRDTRSIDEIVKDMQQEKKRKTLNGEDAKSFSDWFSDKKKTAATTASATPKTAASASSSRASITYLAMVFILIFFQRVPVSEILPYQVLPAALQRKRHQYRLPEHRHRLRSLLRRPFLPFRRSDPDLPTRPDRPRQSLLQSLSKPVLLRRNVLALRVALYHHLRLRDAQVA